MKRKILILAFALISANAFSQPFPCALPLCTGTVVNETYNSTAGWTNASLGTMSVAPSTMNYSFAGEAAGPLRMYKSFPTITPYSNNFVAEFVATITSLAPNQTFCPQHYLFAVTASNTHPQAANNDALFVMLNSVYNVPNNLYFQLAYKDGSTPIVYSPVATAIPLPAAGTYFFRVIKSDVNFQLYIATDPNFTSLIPGAPIHMYVCDVISSLRFVQHGRLDTDIKRKLGAKVDNLKICPYTSGCSFAPSPCRMASNNSNSTLTESEIYLYPNPTSVNIFISNKKAEVIDKVKILNLNGSLVKWVDLKQSDELSSIPIDDVKNGLYLIEIHTNDKVYQQKLSIQH
ncbi:MAG TPA: T9SS type A sorting domain-containing protein [Bacteroidia bacterium]|nr:T9SS type A sorting domain-containing protein [Bacteroidia bacterium]HNU32024.1 T9SS type A sorting domain-containing protein [Bacteroidia bacterium]